MKRIRMILTAFKPCKTVKVINENMRLNLSDEGVLNLLARDADSEDDTMYLDKRWKTMVTPRIGKLFLNVRYCASLLSYKNVSYRTVNFLHALRTTDRPRIQPCSLYVGELEQQIIVRICMCLSNVQVIR